MIHYINDTPCIRCIHREVCIFREKYQDFVTSMQRKDTDSVPEVDTGYKISVFDLNNFGDILYEHLSCRHYIVKNNEEEEIILTACPSTSTHNRKTYKDCLEEIIFNNTDIPYQGTMDR